LHRNDPLQDFTIMHSVNREDDFIAFGISSRCIFFSHISTKNKIDYLKMLLLHKLRSCLFSLPKVLHSYSTFRNIQIPLQIYVFHEYLSDLKTSDYFFKVLE
jgi:hypothetical protein